MELGPLLGFLLKKIRVLVLSLFCTFENSVTEETHINWLKNWNIFMFSTHNLLWAIKENIPKNLTQERKKVWNKPTKPFPNRWKRKLSKSGKGSYYKPREMDQWNEYGKGRYYNEYYVSIISGVTSQKTALLFREHSRRKK